MKYVILPEELTGEFIYLDCGARGDTSNPLLKAFHSAHYVGFDAQPADLPPESNRKFTYFPVVIGKQPETLEFHLTKNPNCSSLFVPNLGFLERFVKVDQFFQIEETHSVNVVALDEFLPSNGIDDLDFIELDTQGSELHILQGAEKFLSAGVLGIRVEVEFAEMYHGQPVFGDVDNWVHQYGFMLFDLERYHLRRKSIPFEVDSREQIVWGQALYLRDFRSFSGDPTVRKQKLGKLAMVASYYGFHSYALEVLGYLTQASGLLTAEEKDQLEHLSAQYISELKYSHNRSVAKWMRVLDRSPLHKVFRRWGNTLIKFYESYQLVIRKQKYFWKD